MKFFAVFITILMLLSGFDGCPEEQECAAGTAKELSSQKHTNDKSSEACSPFCTCLRCAFSVLVPHSEPLVLFLECFKREFPPVLDYQTALSVSSVWQPPQLP